MILRRAARMALPRAAYAEHNGGNYALALASVAVAAAVAIIGQVWRGREAKDVVIATS